MVLHVDRNLVDAGKILALHDAVEIHVTESGNLLANVIVEMLLCAQHKDIGLDTNALKLLHAVLCRLRLQFTSLP